MSLISQAINEVNFFRTHPGADRATWPRYVAWQFRSALNRPAVVPLKQYGVRFYCPADRRGTAKVVYAFRERCEPELPFLSKFVGLGDNTIDIGANLGVYTVALASLVGPSGSVLAVEAASRMFATLRRNIELNGFENVEAIRAAAADREGRVSFFISPDPARSSLVAESAGSAAEEEVQAVRIDSLATRRPVRFMKIDVEGAELVALRGAEQILRTDRPIIQFESIREAEVAYGYEPGALWRFLVDECGYDIYRGRRFEPVREQPPGLVNLYGIHPKGPQVRD